MYDFDAGAICLDFANTVEWHDSDQPQDWIKEYTDLVEWSAQGGLIPAGRADHLCQLAQEQPAGAKAAYTWAVQLRKAIYRLFADYATTEQVDDRDLAILNEGVRTAYANLNMVPTPAGFSWEWLDRPDDFHQVWWPVARSAGELLTSTELDRVAQCADDRGCGYLFYDTSRNRSRRWCSMDSCGNRAKARRHYRRQKQEENKES